MPVEAQNTLVASRTGLRFNRQEWSGAFGDLGTDLPLLVGMILASRIDAASVLTVFGLMQVMTALRYRMPMPVQPLKAMAALVIAQKLPGNLLYGGGLAIGISMLLLTTTGLLEWIDRIVPKPVVRGIQCGLGLQLASIALKDYVPGEGATGWWLAVIGFMLTLWLRGRRRVPTAVILVALGIAYAGFFRWHAVSSLGPLRFHLPQLRYPLTADVWKGFLILALPQIPLSITNSVLATRQLAADLFPEKRITARQIGWTYSLMNLVNPFLGGVPTCHGSGGMAGHFAFGGRTGGSVLIYGTIFIVLGVIFGSSAQVIIQTFPLALLGVLLLFEALTLLALLRDLVQHKADFVLALLVGLLAAGLPYGYLIGLGVGLMYHHLSTKGLVSLDK